MRYCQGLRFDGGHRPLRLRELETHLVSSLSPTDLRMGKPDPEVAFTGTFDGNGLYRSYSGYKKATSRINRIFSDIPGRK
ncbi:hypothetical protein ACSAZL_12890 [Methanosarcina sp. T3]|uniref:hypothetical protein n=1 Tax=Methanosarcina sp. T3 TaxID=3439062 RepID=UPI003F858D21